MVRPDQNQIVGAAAEAVVFGYPLVVSALLLGQMAAAHAERGESTLSGRAGRASAAFGRAEAERTDAGGVDADPLGLLAWLDVAAEPVVLSVPDTPVDDSGVVMLDGWTHVFAPHEPRTNAGAAHTAVAGPYWHGLLPPGVHSVRSPTAIVWLTSPTHSARVRLSHRPSAPGYRLTPLSAWDSRHGSSTTPPPATGPATCALGDRLDAGRGVDRSIPPAGQVAAMHPRVFLGALGLLMADNPPLPADDPVIERIARIGVLIGEEYDWDALDPQARADVRHGVREGLNTVEEAGRAARAAMRRGGGGLRQVGGFGTDYAGRAGAALASLGLLRASAPAGAL